MHLRLEPLSLPLLLMLLTVVGVVEVEVEVCLLLCANSHDILFGTQTNFFSKVHRLDVSLPPFHATTTLPLTVSPPPFHHCHHTST